MCTVKTQPNTGCKKVFESRAFQDKMVPKRNTQPPEEPFQHISSLQVHLLSFAKGLFWIKLEFDKSWDS